MANGFELEPGRSGRHLTYCRLCEAQCGLVATVERGRITRIEADRDHPVSQGHLCIKGPAILDVTYDDDRVLKPLKRVGGPGEFEPVEWDKALDDIATRLSHVLEQCGPSSIGVYVGNPSAFSTQHSASAISFVRLFGSNKVYSAMHVDISARCAASALVFGDGGVYPFPDLPDCDFLMILGGNPIVSHMSLTTVPRAVEKLNAIAKRHGVVVVDPRRTETARRFEHQPIIPDTDVWLLVGMLRSLIEQGKLNDQELEHHATGWSELKSAILAFDPAQASRRCGIPTEEVRRLASRFAQAPWAACYGRAGTNRGRFSTLTNVLIDALNIATGNFGVRGGTIIGHSAFVPVGASAPAMPYGQERSRIGNLPLIMGMQPGGALAADISTPGEEQLRALFLDSGNPVLSYPGGSQTASSLESLDLLVSLDFYVTESSKHAHFVLPTPTFVERADTNDLWGANAPEPWIQCVEAVVQPVGQSRSEFDIYNDLLARLGKPDLYTLLTGTEPTPSPHSARPTDIADFYLRMGIYGDQFGDRPGGLSFAKVLQEHPHGIRHIDRMPAEGSWSQIAHADGKPCLMNPVIEDELHRLRQSQQGDQLRLFGRRLIHSLNSWMHNSPQLARKLNPTLLIHPADASARQIQDGQTVRVVNKNGAISVVVEISESVVEGSVCYPHGFGHDGGWSCANDLTGANVNLIASSDPQDWEQVSGSCFLDGIPVDINPISEATNP